MTEGVVPVLIAPGGVFDARGQWHPVEALQTAIGTLLCARYAAGDPSGELTHAITEMRAWLAACQQMQETAT